jgi:hypothetical protein
MMCRLFGHRWIRRNGWLSNDAAIVITRVAVAGMDGRHDDIYGNLPDRICRRCGVET